MSMRALILGALGACVLAPSYAVAEDELAYTPSPVEPPMRLPPRYGDPRWWQPPLTRPPLRPGHGSFCGGIAGIACPRGSTCIDDPSDTCDPRSGGTDCSGICVPSAPGVPSVPPDASPLLAPGLPDDVGAAAADEAPVDEGAPADEGDVPPS